ncbi:hypothetical protein GKZ28_14655 [Clostridium chromiireducens]|uniref:Uncharacterized protein n=1 Tax=Clostridium chromiireducens TaxID=225345 RepID=A0A964RP09_9CLOT|nr:hypothetical protein [Clostridium chromiireducens]MVX64933.1 hypothetical protein [Clostridium chromiireducens]
MKKLNNIKVICSNSKEDLEKINKKYTLLIAELVKSGQLWCALERE